MCLFVWVCIKLSDLSSTAQSVTTYEPFENPSKPCSVNLKDCRLCRFTAHVVMGVNWMWQGVVHDASLSLNLLLTLLSQRKAKIKLNISRNLQMQGDFKTRLFPCLLTIMECTV